MTFSPKVITIYSVGLLGGSLGLALRASGYAGRIIGLSSPAAIQTALSLKCIDEGYGYDELEAVMKRTDCLFLCSPIFAIMETIKRLGTMTFPETGCIVTDVGSTKATIMDYAQRYLPKSVDFIGGHPMTGSEKHGPSAADPYLFQNAIYVLTPQANVSKENLEGFTGFLEKNLGCRHVVLDPNVHDTIAATVSHVPHLLAVALVTLAAKTNSRVSGTLTLAAGGFRDMTRIASAPYAMWHDILATNKNEISPVIDEFISIVSEMKKQLHNETLGPAFGAAAQTRAGISTFNKGFIRPLSDVYVVVKDQPGMIAVLANECAKVNVNIKDIEVLKVRENEAGTIRLSFESKAIAQKVVDLFNTIGISAWERQ